MTLAASLPAVKEKNPFSIEKSSKADCGVQWDVIGPNGDVVFSSDTWDNANHARTLIKIGYDCAKNGLLKTPLLRGYEVPSYGIMNQR